MEATYMVTCSPQPQRRPRLRHDDAQPDEPVRAAIRRGDMGRAVPLLETGTGRFYRAEERARQRHEGHGTQAGKTGRRGQTALITRSQTADMVFRNGIPCPNLPGRLKPLMKWTPRSGVTLGFPRSARNMPPAVALLWWNIPLHKLSTLWLSFMASRPESG